MKLNLPSGTTGFTDDNGKWVCTGSQMGRCNSLHPYMDENIKLRLQLLPLIDGAYDQWGAYWGSPADLYCAWNASLNTYIFLRAPSREQAKKTIVERFYRNARFYR